MEKVTLQDLRGDIYGGFTAMLVALPSAIAFGLVIFAPMGAQYIGYAALAGMIGTVLVAFFAALFGRTSRLISAPCAPAAAVLSAVVVELLHNSAIDKSQIPFYLLIVSCGAGIIQLLVGKLGGGRFIKYIPYPVVAGYLSGVGVLIFFGQLPRFLGLPAGTNTGNFFSQLPSFQPESLIIGGLTVITMAVAHKIIKQVPAAIVALCVGLLSYLALAQINPRLAVLANNSMIIGPISASPADIWAGISKNWGQITTWGHISWGYIAMPAFTLSVLLSMDTLKTCVVLDALTYSRHNSNRELMGQGIGNIASSLCGGIPGAGTMGATLVNLNSGGRSELSGIVVSLSALVVLLFLGSLIAWIPYSALAGILIVVAIRMIDIKSLRLLKHKSTRFDFFVVLAVVVAAVASNLLSAAGVGIAFAILLFLREQMRSSVIRKKILGNQIFSKKIRLESDLVTLQKKGEQTIILQLQGQLFFGTTDQLLSELEPFLSKCRFVVLDMKRVQSVDYTAAHLMQQLKDRLKKNGAHLVITSIPLSLPTGQNVRSYLEDLGLHERNTLKFFGDLSSGLEWIEENILEEERGEENVKERKLDLKQIEFFKNFPDKYLSEIRKIVNETHYNTGEEIFHAGDESDEMYFIRRGNVRIMMPLEQGGSHHLITFASGAVFGDMSFLDKAHRSARAVAEDEVDLFVLSRDRFDKLVAVHPEIGGMVFERLAKTITARLRQSNIELKAQQEL